MWHKAWRISFTPTSQPSSTNPSYFAPPIHPPRVLLHRFLLCVDMVWVAYDVCLCVCVWHMANANRKRSSSPGLTILTQILRSTGHTAGGRTYAKNNDSAEQFGRGGHMYRCLLCRIEGSENVSCVQPPNRHVHICLDCSHEGHHFQSHHLHVQRTKTASCENDSLMSTHSSEHEHCWTHGSRMNSNFQVKKMNRRITLRKIGEEPQWHSLLGFRYLQSLKDGLLFAEIDTGLPVHRRWDFATCCVLPKTMHSGALFLWRSGIP